MASMKMQQTDLMTQLLADHPQIGQLVWFTVHPEGMTDTAWIQAVADAGLVHYGGLLHITDRTAYLRALRALQQSAAQPTLIRQVARQKGKSIHHWIEESVVNGHMQFRVLAAFTRDHRTSAVTIDRHAALTPSEDAALAQWPTVLHHAYTTVTAGDRRRQITRWLHQIGTLAMASAGPMQFVTEEAAGLVATFNKHQEALGMHVWSLPLHRTADVIATLTQSLETEVTQQTTTLLQRARDAQNTGKPLSLAQQAALVKHLRALESRVTRYAQVFDTQLDSLTTHLDWAKHAVRGALTADAT